MTHQLRPTELHNGQYSKVLRPLGGRGEVLCLTAQGSRSLSPSPSRLVFITNMENTALQRSS